MRHRVLLLTAVLSAILSKNSQEMPHQERAKIILKKSWGDYFLFRIEALAMASEAQPGQFLMIRVNDGWDPFLRRPISVHAREQGALEIFFQAVGRGTDLLARKREGDALDIIGPLGKGFDLGGIRTGETACLVGGGRGIAPLFFLGRKLLSLRAKVETLYGGKSREDLPLKSKLDEAGLEADCSTDDGSYGFPGLVTGLLEAKIRNVRPDILFACGPDPMMKKAAEIAAAHKIPAQLSLESIMGCGFGACWGCVKKIQTPGGGAWKKICEDGPVVRAEDVIWDEA
jgi:dihydroorotate dehydrogenase electron transfer subunit